MSRRLSKRLQAIYSMVDDGVFVADLVEYVEFAVGAHFKGKTNSCGEDNGYQYAYGFKKCVASLFSRIYLVCRDSYRQQQGDK